jgi:hypothetical protein
LRSVSNRLTAKALTGIFGMFVMAAGYVEAMQESGIEESARLAFDAQIARLGTE